MIIEIELESAATIVKDINNNDIGVNIPLTIYVDNDAGRNQTIFCKSHWFENKEELKSYLKKAIEAVIARENNEQERINRLSNAIDMINTNFVGRITIDNWKNIN